jgi:hypothetical protein
MVFLATVMLCLIGRINMALDKQQFDKIIYAGTIYEIKFKGERVLHLRSLRDRNLIVHVPVNSTLLQEYNLEEYINEHNLNSVKTSGV